MLPADTLPVFMEAQKSYTDSQVAQLEQRLTERISGFENRIIGQVEERLRQHRSDLEGIETSINNKLDGVSSDIGEMKEALGVWRVRAESLSSIDMELRDVQAQQISQMEAITTLQSDLYGQPARGRVTLFGMVDNLTLAVEKLAGKVSDQSRWIESETVRQAEARQRWQNRQAAAIAIVKMVPLKTLLPAAVATGSLIAIVIKSLGG